VTELLLRVNGIQAAFGFEFGGDTDTVGAMAGALVGALHGSSWIPARWHGNIENGVHGRNEILTVGKKLAALDFR
jgi:ADP-ribosylglycohydrolase